MSHFDDDTRLEADGDGSWRGHVTPAWNIGNNPNGGYLACIAARALSLAVPDHPDPLGFTIHYLQPGLPGQDCQVRTQVLRAGRQLSTVRATLHRGGRPGWKCSPRSAVSTRTPEANSRSPRRTCHRGRSA
jgi:acyl-CoA thioesterase